MQLNIQTYQTFHFQKNDKESQQTRFIMSTTNIKYIICTVLFQVMKLNPSFKNEKTAETLLNTCGKRKRKAKIFI